MRWWRGILAVNLFAAIITIALACQEKPQPSDADQKAVKEAISAWRKVRDSWIEAQKAWEKVSKAVEAYSRADDAVQKLRAELRTDELFWEQSERNLEKAELEAMKVVEAAGKKRDEAGEEIMETFDRALDVDRVAVELHSATEHSENVLERNLEGASRHGEVVYAKEDAEKEKSLTVPSVTAWLLFYGREKYGVKLYAALRDRYIKVTGRVDRFGTHSTTGERYVSLCGPIALSAGRSVLCTLPKGREIEFAFISKGQIISVVAAVRDSLGDCVVLEVEDCRQVQILSRPRIEDNK